MSRAHSRIGAKQIHRTVARCLQQLVDAVQGGKVGLKRTDVVTMLPKRVGSSVDPRFVRDDKQVIALPRRDLRQFQTNAGRCASDDREGFHG